MDKFYENATGKETLILMKMEDNQVFGAYTNIKWRIDGNSILKRDRGSSFIFFLEDKENRIFKSIAK